MNSCVLAQTKPSATSAPPVPSNLLQRKCACGGTPGLTGECEECRGKRESGMLQRKVAQPSTLYDQRSEVPPIVHEVLRSPGQALDPATRAFMEPRFGHGFSQVRVHADARAAESAQQINAKAYTVGQHIAFASNRYKPESESGRHLLAHELTHTIQQRGAKPGKRQIVSSPRDVLELEARRNERGNTRPQSFATTEFTLIQRDPLVDQDVLSSMAYRFEALSPLQSNDPIWLKLNGMWMKSLLQTLEALEPYQLGILDRHVNEALGIANNRLRVAIDAVKTKKTSSVSGVIDPIVPESLGLHSSRSKTRHSRISDWL